MIVAALENLRNQVPDHAGLIKGVEWLVEHAADPDLPDRVEIDGTNVYALVQSYDTKPTGGDIRLEAHLNYLDIQYIARGEESIGWANVKRLQNPTAYNPDKDVFHGTLPAADVSMVELLAGQAGVYFPEDAHAPKLSGGPGRPVRKIVVKVRIS